MAILEHEPLTATDDKNKDTPEDAAKPIPALAATPVLRRTRPAWLTLIPLLLLTFWMGARGLNADALWYDEWLSVFYAGGANYGPINLEQTWTKVAEISTWPPGFQSSLAGWIAVTGSEQVTMRLLPLLLGVLAVAWLYRLGREMASHRVGLAAAVVVGTSAFFAYYLHELRAYTMYALFVVMMVWAYWRILHGKHDYPTQAALILAVAGSLYTHYFAALVAPGIALFHLLHVKKNRDWWRAPVLMGIGTVLFLPWWGVAFHHAADAFISEERRIVPLGWREITETLFYSFSNGSLALLGLVVIFSLRPLFRRESDRRQAALLTWTWLLVALILGLLLNERLRVIFHVRHLLIALPALALLAGLGIEAIARARRPQPEFRIQLPAAILLLWGVGGVYNTINPAFMENQPGAERTIPWSAFGPALERIKLQADDDDRVALHLEEPGREWLTEPIVDFYLGNLPVDEFRQFEQIKGLAEDDDYYRRAITWLDKAPRLWTVVMPDIPATFHVEQFERVLADKYVHCGRVIDQPDMQVDLYALNRDETNRMDFYFGEDVAARDLGGIPAQTDSILPVTIGFLLNENVPPDTYSIGLHIDNAAGQLVAQHDVSLPDAPYNCVMQDVDVSSLPPGEYTLKLLVYNWQTNHRLTGRDRRAAPYFEGTRVPVQTFVVE